MSDMASTVLSYLDVQNPHFPYVAAGAVVVVTVSGFILHKTFSRKKERPLVEAPLNTAVIYQFKRGPKAPSLSPFPLKLEMFCRVANIPYIVDLKGRMSSKGKTPWMTYNGQIVEDSQFCLRFFKDKKLATDLDSHLNAEQLAIARSIQVLVDEHLYWCIVYFRWIHDDTFFPKMVCQLIKMPKVIFKLVRRKVRQQLWEQGIGRHTAEEIRVILLEDLQALSDFLGDKPFLMGEQLCSVDCSAFGMLAQVEFHQEDPVLSNILKDQFPLLHNYCHRIKEKVWPDWDDVIKQK